MLYIIERRGGVTKSQDTLALIRQLPIEVLPAYEQAVFEAVHLEPVILFPMQMLSLSQQPCAIAQFS